MFMPYANNKGTVQSDQQLVFHCLDSIICLVSISEISRLYSQQVSAAEQAGLCLTLSQTPEGRFSRDMAHMIN